MFKELSKGRYLIDINDKPKEILVSFGVKKELYKIISRGQVAAARLNPQVNMSEDIRNRIIELNRNLSQLKLAEVPDDDLIATADAELELTYREALIDLESRQREALFGVAIKHIDLTSDVMAEGIACLLTERDEKGAITKCITAEEILWGQEYVDATEDLLELLTAVTDYITSALKKISNLKAMIDATTVGSQESPPVSQ